MKKAFLGVVALVAVGVLAARAADPDTVSRERARVQADTNTVTTVTQYTAIRAGCLLTGKVNGTNAVWVAVSAGTNGWVKIAQGQ